MVHVVSKKVVPILFRDHDGYNGTTINSLASHQWQDQDRVLVFTILHRKGVKTPVFRQVQLSTGVTSDPDVTLCFCQPYRLTEDHWV